MTTAVLQRTARTQVEPATIGALAWATVNTAAVVALVVMTATGDNAALQTSASEVVVRAFAALAGTAVGASIAARFPRNPIGWLVLGALTLFLTTGVLETWSRVDLLTSRDWPGGSVAGAVDQSLWLLVFGVLAGLLLVFPTGGPPAGRGWRLIARTGIVVFPAAFLWGLLVAHQRLDPPLEDVRNPLRIAAPDAISMPVNLMLILGCVAVLVASAVSVVVRYRGARQSQRAQLKWMVVAACTLPISVLGCLAVSVVSPSVGDRAASYGFDVVLVAVPLAIACAMTRYRLYAVDRFVDSALVHLTLTALLAGLYAAVVIGAGALVSHDGHRSPAAVAGATLLAALVALPLRRRLQLVIGRRFHRRRYDAVRVIDEYARQLRDERAQLSDLEPTLARALGDPGLQLGLHQAETASYVRPDGSPLGSPGPDQSSFPVVRDGAPVAVLVHDARLDEEPQLLEDVTRAAALPLDSSRLHVELLARLDEVQASRQRIVSAAYEERRRIERDLHDGAQQRLVSLALSLRLARGHVDPAAAEVLDQAAADVTEAIRELRELAGGIHPASLEDGLAAALEALADRTPVPVVLDVPEVDVSSDVAAAAYFTACEAVTNAVKHAVPTRMSIVARCSAGLLVLDVTDDGSGGATTRRGGGLQGLADRLDALGGRLQVTSDEHGTTVHAELPCGR